MIRVNRSSRTNKNRNLRLSLEPLEARMLLHAGHDHAVDSVAAQQIVAKLDSDGDGHLSLDQYESLSPLEQNELNPHLISDPRFDGPVNFDEVLGLPTGLGPTETVELPDFFPTVSSLSLDQTTQPGRNLVRFSTRVNNQGNGPAILISGRPGIDPIPTGAPITSWVNPDGSQNVLQGLYDFNGSSYSLAEYVAAGQFTYHTGHGHFHFDGYAYYRLRYNVNGQPGDYVQRSDGTGAIGEKVGFCLININSSFTMENGQSSTTLPGYGRPGQPSTGCGLLQGIHVGFADVYSSGLSGQWIDVTDVPNGQYFLEVELDGENAVMETNDANNAKTFPYTLNANPPSGGIPLDIFDAQSLNDTFETATDMGEMGTFVQTGLTVHWGGDDDYFRFTATSSGDYTITSAQSNGNIDIYLYDVDQNLLRSSTRDGGNESLSYNFVKGETYYLLAKSYNSSTSSNYQVAWNLKPEVNSATSVPVSVEGGAAGKFTIMRNGPTSSPLTVTFDLAGSATNGVDYQLVPTSVTLGNLQNEAEILIEAVPDGDPEGQETVVLTVTSNNAYVVAATGSQLIITDLSGDFNQDGLLDVADLDLLVAHVALGPADPLFDISGDGLVDNADVDVWLQLAGATNLASGNPYLRGDANLDGLVDGNDFLAWNAHKFTSAAAWSAGDFDANGFVDGNDFLFWNLNKFTSAARSSTLISTSSPLQRDDADDRGMRLHSRKSSYDAIDLALQTME